MSNLLESSSDVTDINIEDSIKSSYLDYSMSVIVGRALPDARDGLKPVHRRVLYAMNDLKVTSKASYKKSARIVGDTIGKYHPHGDTAVYDALVRLAQHFSMRMPLIDGQGNFGSIDGDNAAAMRYTEARMMPIAEDYLKDLEKETVDFVPTYDDSSFEPEVLPTKLPGLLLNGSNGIAVGMATNVPPHRLDELVEALLLVVDNPETSLEEIMEHVIGPDFPTGGTIFGKKGITDAYESGRGKIKLRAKTHIETMKNKEVIVIDEIPYQVNKSRLIEQIANLVKDKHIEGISEVRDESDRDGIRVVIELKRDAMSEIILNNLYKSTSLQITFSIFLLAIENKEPKVFSLIELLKLFLKHRKTVVIRRTLFDLEKSKARAHILEGLRIAVDNIDAIVKMIRASSDTSSAKASLKETFSLSDIQAGAILDMRLGKLTGLERDKLEAELLELMKIIEELTAILKDENLLNELIKEELVEIKEKYSTPRLTVIEDDYDEIDIEDLIPNESMVVTITHNGYIKRVPLDSYEKQNRGGKGKTALTTYEDDFIENFFIANTHDTLLFITNKGQLHWLKVYKIPEGSRVAKGKAVVNLISLSAGESIKAIIPTNDFDNHKSLVFFTKRGIVKRTNLSEYKNIRTVGVKAINLREDDELVNAEIVTPNIQNLFVVTKKGMCIKFNVEDAREIGRVGTGVTAIKFKHEDDEVVGGVTLVDDNQEILALSQKGIGKRTDAGEYRLQSRAGKGVIAMKLTSKTADMVGCVIVEDDKDLMLLTSTGKMIRTDMQNIRQAGRNTSGVIVVRVEGKDKVVALSKCPKAEDVEPDVLEEI
ncbi:MAG: DNA gyrase subunit A (EC [uncultured Campylobacterales bacterium]|uniref:DNA gyrase subunit A n=1 Tax=uncultured Campylobacterales bacterium TaxID=352960 RepID=A0A6S6SXE7_9BACT|nr:MAG: DNA gyrase subunit A (EC [uncultured Campylobacterales bacterium]